MEYEDENQLWKALKGFLYVFMIGCLFYAGAYGFALFFTKNVEHRQKAANYNLLILVLEILILLVLFCIGVANDNPESIMLLLVTLIHIIIIHGSISFVGMIFYLFWYLFTGGDD